MTDSVGSASPEVLFGIAVRAARQARGWSQEALAVKLAEAGIGVGGQSGVVRIERGERPTRLNEAMGIAAFLEIDLAIFSQPTDGTEAEQLSAELGVVQYRLRRLEAEMQAISGERERAKALAVDLERRLKKLTAVRETLRAQRAEIIHGLRETGDARMHRELDMLEGSDRWREREKRYGDR